MSVHDRLLLRNRILGVLIRDAREAAGKSLEACAGFLNMPSDVLAQIERGGRSVSLPELETFAHFVDVPLEHFWGDQLLQPDGKKEAPPKTLFDLRNRIVGALLRRARLAAGKTHQDCGEAIGKPESTVVAYETGQVAVPLPELETLALLLGTSLDTFVDFEHNPMTKKTRPGPPFTELGHLPPELQQFLAEPLNVDYVRTAYRFSKMPVDHLRLIAEALLEITY